MPTTTELLPMDLSRDIVLGGQPSPDDLRAAAARGVRTVINLRMPHEDLGFDEADLVRELGMSYHNLGFKEPHQLTDDIFDQVRDLLGDSDNTPILLHCLSANRVGAVWLPYRVLDHGVPYEDALLEAVEAGLRSEAYVDKAHDYVVRNSPQ